jgi:hypothetical protein
VVVCSNDALKVFETIPSRNDVTGSQSTAANSEFFNPGRCHIPITSFTKKINQHTFSSHSFSFLKNFLFWKFPGSYIFAASHFHGRSFCRYRTQKKLVVQKFIFTFHLHSLPFSLHSVYSVGYIFEKQLSIIKYAKFLVLFILILS